MSRVLLTVVATAGFLTASSGLSAALIHSETFSTNGTIADYTGPGKLFTAYGANNVSGDASTLIGATVSSGALHMNLIGGTTPPVTLIGLSSLGGAQSLVSMKFDLTGINYGSGAYGIYFGRFYDTVGGSQGGHNFTS